MRKIGKYILLLTGVIWILCGCGKQSGPGHLVVQAEVTYQHQQKLLMRRYTDQKALGQLLTQLRLTKSVGFAREDPDCIAGDRCRIELHYQDGSRSVIFLQANRYRSRNFHRWELVDEKQAEKLYPLLKSLPGDVSQTWAWKDTGRRCPATV